MVTVKSAECVHSESFLVFTQSLRQYATILLVFFLMLRHYKNELIEIIPDLKLDGLNFNNWSLAVF